MIPRILLSGEKIPYTVGGKIDRSAVIRLLAAAEPPTEHGYRAPSTPLELALAAIVGEVLGRTGIGVDDDFFALGGDSVLATAVVARVRDWLDARTAMVADMFASKTVAALADRLTARESEPSRLDRVAELYLEVVDMDDADVAAALDSATSS